MYLAGARKRVVSDSYLRSVFRRIGEFDRLNFNEGEVTNVKISLEQLEPSGERDEYISKVASLLQLFERVKQLRHDYETSRNQLSSGYNDLISDAESGTGYSALKVLDRYNFVKSQLQSVKQELEQLEPSVTRDDFINKIERLIQGFDYASTLEINHKELKEQFARKYNDLIDETQHLLSLPAPAA